MFTLFRINSTKSDAGERITSTASIRMLEPKQFSVITPDTPGIYVYKPSVTGKSFEMTHTYKNQPIQDDIEDMELLCHEDIEDMELLCHEDINTSG
jgi:hypothetical protein